VGTDSARHAPVIHNLRTMADSVKANQHDKTTCFGGNMTEQKDIIGKLTDDDTQANGRFKRINTPTTLSITAIVLVVLLQVGLIGPTSRNAAGVTKDDLAVVTEQAEQRDRSIIENQKAIMVSQATIAERVVILTTIQQAMLEELREMRRSRP
jgi:hypothetical protein